MATGMDLVNAIREERADPPSGIRTLGLDRTHRWLTVVEPGHVEMRWEVDDAYFNLESAVICSWTVALADQALFFAGNTLCGEGEGTRMASLGLDCIHNISSGVVTIDARIRERADDRMFGVCDFLLDDGRLAASVVGTMDVIR